VIITFERFFQLDLEEKALDDVIAAGYSCLALFVCQQTSNGLIYFNFMFRRTDCMLKDLSIELISSVEPESGQQKREPKVP
jgi:hypothetical protein